MALFSTKKILFRYFFQSLQSKEFLVHHYSESLENALQWISRYSFLPLSSSWNDEAGGLFGFSAVMLDRRRHICTMQMCYDDDLPTEVPTATYPKNLFSVIVVNAHTIRVFFIACKIQTPTRLTYVGEDSLFSEILAFL